MTESDKLKTLMQKSDLYYCTASESAKLGYYSYYIALSYYGNYVQYGPKFSMSVVNHA